MNAWSEAAISAKANNHNVSLEQQQQQEEEASRRAEFSTCGLSTLQSLVKLWHILDAFLGLSLVIYGLSILSTHSYLPICLTLGMGVLLCTRSMAGLSALTAVITQFVGRCGLQLSGMYLSPLAAIVFFVMTCLSNMYAFSTYLNNHHKQLHLSWLLELQRHYPHVLLTTFSIATLVEMIRWYMVPRLYQWLVVFDTHMASSIVAPTLTTPTTTTTTPRRKQQPWWWQQQRHPPDTTTTTTGDLYDPLLSENDYPPWAQYNKNQSFSIHHGTTPQQQQEQQQDTSFWSKWFGREEEEEGGEVSFQSIQEEWASKSEEDPLWWSREEQEEVTTTTSHTTKESWTRKT